MKFQNFEYLLLFILLKINISITLNEIEENESLESISKVITNNLQEFSNKKILGFNFKNYYNYQNISIISEEEPSQLILQNIQPFIIVSNDSLLLNEEEKSIIYKELMFNMKFDLTITHYSPNSNSTIIFNKTNLFSQNKISNLIFKKVSGSPKFELFNIYQETQLLSYIDFFETNLFYNKKNQTLKLITDSLGNSLNNYLKNIIFYYPQNDLQKKIIKVCNNLKGVAYVNNHILESLQRIEFQELDYIMDSDNKIRNITIKLNFTVDYISYKNEYAYLYNATFSLGFSCDSFETSFDKKRIIDKNTFYNGLISCIIDASYNS